MRFARTLTTGLDWAAALGGLALCVLILLAASLAFEDRGARTASRQDEALRLPSVPQADVPLGGPRGTPTPRLAP